MPEEYCENGHARTHPEPDCLYCKFHHRVTMNPDYLLPDGVSYDWIRFSEMDEPGELQNRVSPLIPEEGITLLYGDSGQAESYIATAMALCVAEGISFLDFKVKQGVVLYLDWELTRRERARRAYAVARGLGLERLPDDLFYMEMRSRVTHELRAVIKEFDVKLVVIESVGPACGGDPETANFVIPFFQSMRALDTTVLLTDRQSPRTEEPFGSVYKRHLSQSVLQVQQLGDSVNPQHLVLRHKKFSFGPRHPDTGIRITFDESGTVSLEKIDGVNIPRGTDPGKISIDDRVLSCLVNGGPQTAESLAEENGLNIGTVRNALTRLKRKRRVQEVGKEKENRGVIYKAGEGEYHKKE